MLGKSKLVHLAAIAVLPLLAAGNALAHNISTSLDVNALWTGLSGDGYLEFINPTEHPGLLGTTVPTSPPGVIQTEEHTGFTGVNGNDIIEAGDSDTTAGDRADFDWVQENRSDEFANLSNHPGVVGAMGWTVGTPETSLHVDLGRPHAHSAAEGIAGGLPELDNDIYTLPFFNTVDIFSIISIGEDTDADASGLFSPRDAALDYVVDFVNTATGAFSPGVANKVWVPGWTAATTIDDFVARWVPLNGGVYDFVAIEPTSGSGHDQVTEIDAIKAAMRVPEPGTLALFGFGLAGIGYMRRRRKTI